MPRPAASSAALLMRSPDERRSIAWEILSEVWARWRWAAIASTLLLMRRAIGVGFLSCCLMLLVGAAGRRGDVGQLGGGLSRRGVLGRDGRPDLLPVHGDRLGRGDAHAHGRAGDFHHLDHDVVSDADL